MSYNRSLDLLAVSLAASIAGMPVKAAKYMRAAGKDVKAAMAAIDAISAANSITESAAKKKAKKKAKASVFEAMAEDDEMPGEETAMDEYDEGDVMTMESSSKSIARRLRSALTADADEMPMDDYEEKAMDDYEEKTMEEDEYEEKASSRRSVAARMRRALATPELVGEDMADLEPGEAGADEKVETPVMRETARFARTLRNLAARQHG